MPALLVECKECNCGCIMIGAGLGRGVDDRKHAVATFGGGDGFTVFQKFFAAKEGYPGPIDEFGEIFLLVDQGVVVSRGK